MLVEAEGLSKNHKGRTVLDRFSIRVLPRRIMGLLGANGAGKSTALKIMAGYVRPDAGKVLLDNEDVSGLPPWRRVRLGLAYLPQESTIFQDLTVEENVLAANPDDPDKARGIVEFAGLKNVKETKGRYLSGGERRRAEIARLLALPGIEALMLDEPFAALDPAAVSKIKRLLVALARDQGMAIILADHSARDVMSISDQCLLMSRGRTVTTAAPRTLARDPRAREVYLGPDFVAPRRMRATGME